ncbi:hypothetical protein [Alteromonas sp. BMJM2]|uniref:hypothetical protein n=1 Tax=Alteromonas sp. BMJM2 TaxID=2954241 RepID=UPI0022B38406|nr:hypothetical protein [Alteromonas sp. BMJM2]
MELNKQSLTNEASANASDVFSLSVSPPSTATKYGNKVLQQSTATKYGNKPETELNIIREPTMKTLTGIFLLSACLTAALFPHNLAAAEDAKHQPNFNRSEHAQPIFKKIRRSATDLPSRVPQRIITSRNSKTPLKQAHLIHTVLPYSLSQPE